MRRMKARELAQGRRRPRRSGLGDASTRVGWFEGDGVAHLVLQQRGAIREQRAQRLVFGAERLLRDVDDAEMESIRLVVFSLWRATEAPWNEYLFRGVLHRAHASQQSGVRSTVLTCFCSSHAR